MLHEKYCKLCGKTFLTESKRRLICSKECYNSRRPRDVKVAITVNCLHCKTPFNVTPKRIELGRGKYCSKECKAKAKEFISTCQYCSKEFKTYVSRIEQKYCSKECQVQSVFIDNKKVGADHYNYKGAVHANTYRREAFAIHDNKCFKCGTDENVQVHHIDHNRRNNPSDGSNWEILCLNCHWEYHGFIKGQLSNVRKINCPYCQKEFIARNKNIKHCSRTCAVKHQHKRKRESLTYNHHL